MNKKRTIDGERSAHQDEPIIIDNGPTQMDLLPDGHQGALKKIPKSGGKNWMIDEHNQHLYLVIGFDGPIQLKSASNVQIIFFSKPGQNWEKAGELTISWSSGTTFLTSTDATNNGPVLRWKQRGNVNGKHGLQGAKKNEKDDEDYRIKSIAFTTNYGSFTWTNTATDLKESHIRIGLHSVWPPQR